jgi:hypothetical protein
MNIPIGTQACGLEMNATRIPTDQAIRTSFAIEWLVNRQGIANAPFDAMGNRMRIAAFSDESDRADKRAESRGHHGRVWFLNATPRHPDPPYGTERPKA